MPAYSVPDAGASHLVHYDSLLSWGSQGWRLRARGRHEGARPVDSLAPRVAKDVANDAACDLLAYFAAREREPGTFRLICCGL